MEESGYIHHDFPKPFRDKPDGAAEETRTPDIQLGKLTLYQLSYGRYLFERNSLGAFWKRWLRAFCLRFALGLFECW